MAGQVPPLQRIVETDDDLEAKLASKGLKGETCSQYAPPSSINYGLLLGAIRPCPALLYTLPAKLGQASFTSQCWKWRGGQAHAAASFLRSSALGWTRTTRLPCNSLW